MKIIFAGTPEFAIPTLQALLNSEHTVVAVYTQPDRPKGRGQKLTASPIKQLALQHQLTLFQPTTLRDEKIQHQLKNLNADIMVVVAYGLLLPKAVLTIPRLGCINVHASLLPRWRGAAPIQHAILAGDAETGITIMQMNQGLDTGNMLRQSRCIIAAAETSQSLHDKLAALGATSLLQTLKEITENKIQSISQNESLATYAAKITKEQAQLNWQLNAEQLERQVRAFNPWPIAFMIWQQQTVRVWQAQALAVDHQAAPGTLIAATPQGIDIATGKGMLRILKLQLPGSKPITAADFINAHQGWLPGKLL